MTALVRLPAPLRPCVGGLAQVAVSATTVGAALGALVERHPRLRRHLFAEDGRLRSFVNVYLNDDDVRYLAGEETIMKDGDVVTVVPSIAGGAEGAPETGAGAFTGTGTFTGSGSTGSASPEPGPVPEPGAGSAAPGLSSAEVLRYSRHIIMPEVGWEGQHKLKAAKVLLVGAGGLGSPLGLYLAAAGVGTLGLVDFDVVDETNLQRQVLYGTGDIGRPKLDAALERLRGVNPHITLVPHPVRLSSANALELFEPYDVIVDGSDNFPTRYLVNDACVLLGKPNVYGSIFRFEGQVSVFGAPGGPCYRCLFREPPPPGLVPSCAEGGVLGVLPGIIGSLQALETLKLILGRGDPMIGRLLLFDALAMRWRELKLRRNPECPACGDRPTITGLIDYEEFCGLKAPAPADAGIPELTAAELKERIERGDGLVLVDVREPYEWEIANLGAYGARLIPLGQLAERLDELDPRAEIVLHCRSGARAARALEQLRAAGFERLWNLKGGILAWADAVDPSLRRY